ncbi:MAG: hypothetical protein ACPG4U_07740 [Pseudomonadales bacterium]
MPALLLQLSLNAYRLPFIGKIPIIDLLIYSRVRSMPNIAELEQALKDKLAHLEAVKTGAGDIELTPAMREELKQALEKIIGDEIQRQKEALLCFIDQELFELEKQQL